MATEKEPGLIVRAWRAVLAAAPVKIWAQIGAAVALTMVLVAGAWVIWKGPWAAVYQGKQLDALFYLLVGVELLMMVALAAITGLSVNVHGGRDGIHASIDQDEAQPLEVKTTVATTVKPASLAPADDGELPPEQRVQP
ncbi:hypothetical protein [Phenylobacterium koreense]|uniref:Type VI protein secretion system component VasK n=1 Tax=Phenylobacterium koreense TaxID=266125 RepID=A0ABV2EJT9_9CAUL